MCKWSISWEKSYFFIPISTMQMIIFHQSCFVGITVSFYDNILEKQHTLCKIYPVFVSDTLEPLKHQTCFLLLFSYVYVVILVRCCWVFIRENIMACKKQNKE